MAKDKQNADELEFHLDLDDDEEQEKQEESSDQQQTQEPELTVSTESFDQKAPEQKRVKIKVKKYIRTCIGGVWYDLHPNKEYSVPPHVKEILRNGGVLVAV